MGIFFPFCANSRAIYLLLSLVFISTFGIYRYMVSLLGERGERVSGLFLDLAMGCEESTVKLTFLMFQASIVYLYFTVCLYILAYS